MTVVILLVPISIAVVINGLFMILIYNTFNIVLPYNGLSKTDINRVVRLLFYCTVC